MGADQSALVAHEALLGDPLRDGDGDAALLIAGGAGGHGAVGAHGGHGQRVAFLREDGLDIALEVRIVGHGHDLGALGGGGPGFRILNLLHRVDADVDGVVILLDHGVALLGVGLLGGGLHEAHGILHGDHVGQLEEGSLHDGVDAPAHADLESQLDGVDVVELQMVLGDGVLEGRGQLLLHLLQGPGAVEEERAALLDAAGHVVLRDIGRIVAGHEVRAVDEVGALDGGLAEAQMADGETAGLLGVVGKVALGVHVGVVADDLDGVLVGAYGAVGAEAVELAGDGALGGRVDGGAERQAEIGHVVDDAHGEVVLGLGLAEVVVDGLDHGGIELLAAQAVAAADHNEILPTGFPQGGAHVGVQGLAQGAGLLGAVHDGQLLAGGGDGGQELIGGEGPIQADLDEAQLLAPGVQVVDGLLGHVGAAAHDDDHPVGIGGAHVVEEVVGPAGEGADLLHVVLHDGGNGLIILVGRFAILEVDVGVLGRAAQVGMLGVQGPLTELLHRVVVQELTHVLIVDDLDLLDLVGGAEAVEEVDEGHGRLDGGKVGDEGQVHDLLDGGGGDHGKAGLTAGHDVALVAEDGQGVGGQGPGGHVEHAGQQLAADLIHVGDHQEQALRSREGGGQRAALEGAVDRAGSAALGLHLGDADLLAEQIDPAVGSPVVGHLRHGRRRGDGVNCGNVGKCVSHMACRGVPVDCHGLCHTIILLFFLGHIWALIIRMYYRLSCPLCQGKPAGIYGKKREKADAGQRLLCVSLCSAYSSVLKPAKRSARLVVVLVTGGSS